MKIVMIIFKASKSVVNYCTYIYFTNCILQDFVYPENVAYPVGGPGNARFLVMEIHYDNPDSHSGMLGDTVLNH